MELDQAHFFLAVSEEGSFDRAAERCGVSLPSLSNGIKQMEMELGGILFHREPGAVRLSALGTAVLPHVEKFYGHARDLWHKLEALKQTLQPRGQHPDGAPYALCAQSAASGGHRGPDAPGNPYPREVDMAVEGHSKPIRVVGG